MDTVFVILPAHLYADGPILGCDLVVVLEHPLYFTKYPYHKMKLVLHRASMTQYYDHLKFPRKQYVKYDKYDPDSLLSGKSVVMYDPMNHDLVKEFKKYANKLTILSSPGFICTNEDLKEYYISSDALNQGIFFKYFKKKYNILVNVESQDKKNRNPFPKDLQVERKPKKVDGKYVVLAILAIEKAFPNNPGKSDIWLPVDRNGALKRLKRFIKKRLDNFGKYEDAVSKKVIIGYHSGLSALINIGLLTPMEVMDAVLEAGGPIESVEGFVRQLFWREYMAYCYKYHCSELKSGNFFGNRVKLPKYWFENPKYSVNKMPPFINHLLMKVWKYGYLHHIERLMFVGNYFLISGISPKSVFKWYMSLFVDAISPWVMIPNVYGMSQFSCGRLIMRRPYVCSSNYVKKMSDFTSDEIGDELDLLYHAFMKKHKIKMKKFKYF